jgi:hypothetical protein
LNPELGYKWFLLFAGTSTAIPFATKKVSFSSFFQIGELDEKFIEN